MPPLSSLEQLTEEQIHELSMVDIAFHLLQKGNKPYNYRELLKEIADIKGMSEQEMMDVIAQLYTELNLDGRFVCVGQNTWGLKRWYPLEQQEDAAEGIMARDDYDDDLDDLIDEDDDYDDDLDDDEDLDDEDDDEDDEDDIDEDDDFDDFDDEEEPVIDEDFDDEPFVETEEEED